MHEVKRVRKPWTCEKCGVEIKVGDPAIKFAVGFRGRTRVRCAKTECYPKPSERESSMVADAYAAQEEVDVDSAGSLEELEQIRDDVVSATREVAGEYEDSEMFEKNYDLQERADMLNSAADELEGWEPDGEEPEEEIDCDECGGTGQVEDPKTDGEDRDCDECEGTGKVENPEDRDIWLQAARESLSEAIDGMELP